MLSTRHILLVSFVLIIINACSFVDNKEFKILEYPQSTTVYILLYNSSSTQEKIFKLYGENQSRRDTNITVYFNTVKENVFYYNNLQSLNVQRAIYTTNILTATTSLPIAIGSETNLNVYYYQTDTTFTKVKRQFKLYSIGLNNIFGDTNGIGPFILFLDKELNDSVAKFVAEKINAYSDSIIKFIVDELSYKYIYSPYQIGVVLIKKPQDFLIDGYTESSIGNSIAYLSNFIYVYVDTQKSQEEIKRRTLSLIAHELQHVFYRVNGINTTNDIWFDEAKSEYTEAFYTKKFYPEEKTFYEPVYFFLNTLDMSGVLEKFKNKPEDYGAAYSLLRFITYNKPMQYIEGYSGIQTLEYMAGRRIEDILREFYMHCYFFKHPDTEIAQMQSKVTYQSVPLEISSHTVAPLQVKAFCASPIDGSSKPIKIYVNKNAIVNEIKRENNKVYIILE